MIWTSQCSLSNCSLGLAGERMWAILVQRVGRVHLKSFPNGQTSSQWTVPAGDTHIKTDRERERKKKKAWIEREREREHREREQEERERKECREMTCSKAVDTRNCMWKPIFLPPSWPPTPDSTRDGPWAYLDLPLLHNLWTITSLRRKQDIFQGITCG